MATGAKKTVNTKKVETTVDTTALENAMNEPVVEVAEKAAEPIIVKQKEPKKFGADEGIDCESITAGELGLIGHKTHINYRWAERGDVTQVEYQDLVAAVRSNASHIYKPLFIIRNEDFIAQFPQVAKAYDAMYTVKDLRDVLRMPLSQMKSVIKTLPDGAKDSLKTLAATMINNGSLDSIQKVKALDEIFDTKLMLLTELYDA